MVLRCRKPVGVLMFKCVHCQNLISIEKRTPVLIFLWMEDDGYSPYPFPLNKLRVPSYIVNGVKQCYGCSEIVKYLLGYALFYNSNGAYFYSHQLTSMSWISFMTVDFFMMNSHPAYVVWKAFLNHDLFDSN